MNNWLAIGPQPYWEIAARESLWSVSSTHHKAWSRIEPDDTLFYYCMTPVKGVIGFGKILKTYCEEKKLVWPAEMEEKQVLWPYRMKLQTQFLIPPDDWMTRKITLERGNITFQRSFQALKSETAIELINAFKSCRSK